MKVLHVVPAYAPEGPGGIELYVASLVRAQRALGLRPLVLTGCAEPWARVGVEVAEVDGYRVLRLHRDDLYFHHHAKAYHPGVEEAWERTLGDERPDVVHVHHWLRLTCNLVEVAARCGVPAVVTLHDTYTSCPRCFRVHRDQSHCERELAAASCRDCVPRWGCETEPEIARGIELFRAAYRHELTRARAVLAPSAPLGELVARTTGVDPARIETMPLGCERHGAATARQPVVRRPGEPLRFAHWGNVARHKGVVTLLRAMRQLATDGGAPPLALHVLGPVESAEFRAELDELARGLPVAFHGAFTFADLAALQPHAGVFPSHCFESFSLVLEECFDLGAPCIVSALGALPQRAGAAALVVPPGDAGALAAAMRRLAVEPDLLAALARQLPPPSPSPAQHAEQLRRVYERAIAAPSPAATPPVSARQWAQFLAMQRDSAQARVCKPGGPD